MEAIRKFRRAIGPEAETLIFVGLGIAAFLALLFLMPKEGWPAVAVWVIGGASVLVIMLMLLTPRHWTTWREHPFAMSVRFLALGLMAAGMATYAWAEFVGRTDHLSILMIPGGAFLSVLADFGRKNRSS